ncbi:MAG: DUF58 domain-containing protein [Planctomycetota bacterium]|nr:DUF58 domain-containing protein [Planctomycetota bacterium]MDA1180296.1 DUF58 domain-containing protein [Planctomycetota bacterium]
MATSNWTRTQLEPAVLARLSAVPLVSRRLMLGHLSGRHRSAHRGSSVEFAEYRRYVPGDDLRRVDWRAFGRTERYYVKEFEADTNLRCCLVLDTSGSMGFRGKHGSKIQYAQQMIGTLSYLAIQQGDAVGIACAAEGLVTQLPPRRNPAHLSSIFEVLERLEPKGSTQLVPVLHELADSLRQRAMVVVVSDFFVDSSELRGCFEHLRFKKHDVTAFQLLDPMEIEFDLKRPMRFLDLEGGAAVFADPIEIADRYHLARETFQRSLQQMFLEAGVEYHCLQLDETYDQALMRFLVDRNQR